jgi:hypothetical protein
VARQQPIGIERLEVRDVLALRALERPVDDADLREREQRHVTQLRLPADRRLQRRRSHEHNRARDEHDNRPVHARAPSVISSSVVTVRQLRAVARTPRSCSTRVASFDGRGRRALEHRHRGR